MRVNMAAEFEFSLENPAPANAGENFNKIKEKYIKSILMQLHQAIRAQDYLGKSLGDLVALAAANEPNEQIKPLKLLGLLFPV
ncbi:MAG: hypothetical protein QXD27_09590 [Metallosphaera sp.]